MNKPSAAIRDASAALEDLKSKAPFRAKFGVLDDWVLPFEVIPIINHPEFGDKSAEKCKPQVCSRIRDTTSTAAECHGVQALDLKLPFGEIEVLRKNSELIKRQIGLEHVEVLSAADPDAAIKAGPYASLLKQSPPTPGPPTCIFLTKEAIFDELVSSITQVVNLFLEGKCPMMLGEYIASAPLTPLVKPGGGIRPIAVGTIWRRLVSK
ncbi:leucine--tRNA ligase, cytoplasmic-like protein, partial [Tanacetum coccineum]